MTLTCEDANSKLVEVVTVADVNAEKFVGDILVQIWKLKFGHKFIFWFILANRFGKDFEIEVHERF